MVQDENNIQQLTKLGGLNLGKETSEEGQWDSSISKVLAVQAWGPEFNSHHPQKKKPGMCGNCNPSTREMDTGR